MLFGMVLPSWLEAEMFHALALIPMIQVKDHVTDIAGRAGVAFVLPETKQSEKAEIILDASDYHLLADAHLGQPQCGVAGHRDRDTEGVSGRAAGQHPAGHRTAERGRAGG